MALMLDQTSTTSLKSSWHWSIATPALMPTRVATLTRSRQSHHQLCSISPVSSYESCQSALTIEASSLPPQEHVNPRSRVYSFSTPHHIHHDDQKGLSSKDTESITPATPSAAPPATLWAVNHTRYEPLRSHSPHCPVPVLLDWCKLHGIQVGGWHCRTSTRWASERLGFRGLGHLGCRSACPGGPIGLPLRPLRDQWHDGGERLERQPECKVCLVAGDPLAHGLALSLQLDNLLGPPVRQPRLHLGHHRSSGHCHDGQLGICPNGRSVGFIDLDLDLEFSLTLHCAGIFRNLCNRWFACAQQGWAPNRPSP
eukprot:m.273579 g.273579  ORF g.273579 m.273579 type:complete len:312 (-) comp26885_c1_seq7:4435-5370(-)